MGVEDTSEESESDDESEDVEEEEELDDDDHEGLFVFLGANFGFTVSINNAGDRWASGNHYYLSGNTGPNFAKVFQTEEFSIPAPAEASFVVYPNPSRGEFTIFTNELSSAFSLTVLDQLGKLIYSEEYIDESSFSLNLDLQPGFYFLRLKDKSGTPLGVEKLIVH